MPAYYILCAAASAWGKVHAYGARLVTASPDLMEYVMRSCVLCRAAVYAQLRVWMREMPTERGRETGVSGKGQGYPIIMSIITNLARLKKKKERGMGLLRSTHGSKYGEWRMEYGLVGSLLLVGKCLLPSSSPLPLTHPQVALLVSK
jgi:hypothetical protein